MKIDLEKYDACEEGIKWFETQKSNKTAWQNCERADWMLWIATKSGVDEKKLIRVKALCVLSIKHLLRDKRSKEALITALSYSESRATKKELKAAHTAASAACDASYSFVSSAAAAYTAAAYTIAATAATYATADAATANAAAYTIAATARAANAHKDQHRKMASICREILTKEFLKRIKR